MWVKCPSNWSLLFRPILLSLFKGLETQFKKVIFLLGFGALFLFFLGPFEPEALGNGLGHLGPGPALGLVKVCLAIPLGNLWACKTALLAVRLADQMAWEIKIIGLCCGLAMCHGSGNTYGLHA